MLPPDCPPVDTREMKSSVRFGQAASPNVLFLFFVIYTLSEIACARNFNFAAFEPEKYTTAGKNTSTKGPSVCAALLLFLLLLL